jgi:hypothetical protein
MSAEAPAALLRLDDIDMTVADPATDVRGRAVIGRGGAEIGKISSLLVDDGEWRVRLLEVRSGGLLGIGARTRLIPVEAVTDVVDDAVHVDQTRTSVQESPVYDPDVAPSPALYADVYDHFGYSPFWAIGHPYPPVPDADAPRGDARG